MVRGTTFKASLNLMVLDERIQLSFSEQGRLWPVTYQQMKGRKMILVVIESPSDFVKPREREVLVLPFGECVTVHAASGEFTVQDIFGNQINGKAMMLKPVTKEDCT